MGLWRKYALFLYIAALQSADNESYGVAHALVSCDDLGFNDKLYVVISSMFYYILHMYDLWYYCNMLNSIVIPPFYLYLDPLCVP